MRERARVDDPYAKPWIARDAAKNVVKQAVASGYTPSEMIDHMHGIYRPDYTAVVGQLVGAQPPREIQPTEIGVTGFAPEGEVFPLAEVWQQVTGKEMPPYQASLAAEKPKRGRKKRNVDSEMGG
jgi:hypothetical protein